MREFELWKQSFHISQKNNSMCYLTIECVWRKTNLGCNCWHFIFTPHGLGQLFSILCSSHLGDSNIFLPPCKMYIFKALSYSLIFCRSCYLVHLGLLGGADASWSTFSSSQHWGGGFLSIATTFPPWRCHVPGNPCNKQSQAFRVNFKNQRKNWSG